MDLYLYATPAGTALLLTLDDGRSCIGEPCVWQGRADAFRVAIPANVGSMGAWLELEAPGCMPYKLRGIVQQAGSSASIAIDDFFLQPTPAEPVPEPPPFSGTPAEIIEQVWATGQYELETKEGCGTFTEGVCLALYRCNSPAWGHIRKSGAQNQWNGHAVDAVQCLAGPDLGIWDVIHDSESENATPSCTYKGPPDPALWYPPV